MNKIPEDIMVRAEAAYDALGRGSDADAQVIARAILAERKRCAEAATHLPLCELTAVSPSGGITPKMAFGVGAGAQRDAIAKAIEAGQ